MLTSHILSLTITLNILSTCSFQIPLSIHTTPSSPTASSSNFEIRHAIHIGTRKHPGLHAWRRFNKSDRETIDVRSLSTEQESYPSTHRLRFKKSTIWSHHSNFTRWSKVREQQVHVHRLQNRKTNFNTLTSDLNSTQQLDWKQIEIDMPDISDIQTLSNLAKMSNNAYTLPGDPDWYDHHNHWNLSDSFGWQDDGLRGHIFATPDNSTVVVSIKGTSSGFLGNGGPTTSHDKTNDNLFFSCCCARISWSWTTVCDCYDSTNRCRQSCLENALMDKSTYFMAGVELYEDVVKLYPNSQIWLSGHSLGAGIAGLLGLTFGLPVVGFEAPGDLLAAKRLHLPLPPGASFGNGQELSAVTHVFHTADPIAMGVCNGALSTCSIAGFALETRCHIGKVIMFDTVNALNWAVDIRNHAIKTVIEKVLIPDWNPECNKNNKTNLLSNKRWSWLSFDFKKNQRDQSKTCNESKSNVPIAINQNCTIEDCSDWSFQDSWD